MALEEAHEVSLRLSGKKQEAEVHRLAMQWESKLSTVVLQLQDANEQRDADVANVIAQKDSELKVSELQYIGYL